MINLTNYPVDAWIESLNYPKLEVVQPIPIIITKSDGVWVPTCPIFNHEYSSSIESEEAALCSLQASIVELYYILNQNKNNLGPEMEKVWKVMQNYIKEI